jgi:DinB family protein
MGARAESLAKKYEAKAAELTATIQKLSDADWKKVTTAEKWPVGVTAHHVAGAHEPISGIVKTIASGQSIPNFTPGMLDEMNAKHAKDFAGCSKVETLALHEKGVKAAAAVVRSLGDADLDKSGTVLTGMPAMTAHQVVEGILISHIDEHMGSIRKTVGA